jgi:hypothetical protein
MIRDKSWLGQVPLILGPSSWGAGGGVPVGQQLRCWKTQDGGTTCTNGLYYLPN